MSQSSIIVGKGATLKCTFGTASSKLMVVDHRMKTIGKSQAIITDMVPMMNIMPFCSCNRPNPVMPVPCTPIVVMPWLNSDVNLRLGGIPMLQKKCIVPCMWGGMIRIVKE